MSQFDITKTEIPPTTCLVYNWFHHCMYFGRPKERKVSGRLLSEIEYQDYELEIDPLRGFRLFKDGHSFVQIPLSSLNIDRIEITDGERVIDNELIIYGEPCALALHIDYHALMILRIIKEIDDHASMGARELGKLVIERWPKAEPNQVPVVILCWLEIMTGIKFTG